MNFPPLVKCRNLHRLSRKDGASPVAGDGDGEGVGGGEVGGEGLEEAAVGAHVDHGEAILLFRKIIEFVIEIISFVNRSENDLQTDVRSFMTS